MTLPLLALLFFGPKGHVPGVASGRMNEIVAGEVLVKFHPSVAADLFARADAPASRKAVRSAVPGGQIVSQIAHSGWTLWRIPASTDSQAFATGLKGRPGVLAAQPVHRIYPLLSDPNDADWNALETSEDLLLYFGDGDPTPFRRLWHIDDTNAFAGWNVWPNRYYTAATKPIDPPIIAVIDTGCDMDHPDFVNAGGTSTDSAQGGQLDKALSHRFELGEEVPGSPDDLNGHGTHVAGLALAAANNGAFAGHGVVGTGYACRGMILRVFDDQGVGTDADAAAAMYYAADHGADVINLSLGTTNFSQLFQDASTYAFQMGSLVVAAGNENGSGGGDLGPIYPAACSGVLAVEANGPDGVPATGTYSGYGPYVDIAAPGGDLVQTEEQYTIQFVYSTATRDPNAALPNNPNLYPPYTNDYAYLAGTSMATPQVAGAAGLYYGKNALDQRSGWSNLRTYRALELSAAGVMGAPHGSWEYYHGYGCLDVESLLLDYNARSATVGAVKGMVYYNGTAFQNVAVKAKKVGGTVTYSTTTRSDGGFRFEQLPPGIYTVTSAPFGAVKSRSATVTAGSDLAGFDFWCGAYTGDDTPPTIARFDVTSATSTGFSLRHWAYDTETGIDKMTLRVGTVPGATDVLADTELFPENPVATLTGLSLPTFNSIQGHYIDGAGMVATATLATIPVSADTYVSKNAPNAAFEGSTAIQLDNNPIEQVYRGYLKLDISAVPGDVKSATLRFALVARKATPNEPTLVRFTPTSSGWTPSSLTWNTAPAATGGTAASIVVARSTSYAWYQVDITAYVRAERAAGRSTMSLIVDGPPRGSGVQMGSSESGAMAPQLIVNAQG